MKMKLKPIKSTRFHPFNTESTGQHLGDGVHVPAWFIPQHELDVDTGESADTLLHSIITVRAKWLGSVVMVSTFDMASRSEFAEAMQTWVLLSHPNVVKLFGASHVQLPFKVVFENALHTNLRNYGGCWKSSFTMAEAWRLGFSTLMSKV
uniref:Protein kinase domain-containing protein n=1 Tax=Globisporangium ultimum (strain ATCC 200006 / CBS 805.95 / DAOM BR144) TaxID=431595 RepID=K3WT02_GLOUD